MRIFIGFIVVILSLYIAKLATEIPGSLFMNAPNRLQVVIYREYPTLFSFGLQDELHYAFSFYPDLEVSVPGCYGSYRLGALGKLSGYDKKPVLLQKTFSQISSSIVSYYFYEPKVQNSVYFGAAKEEDAPVQKPSAAEILRMSSETSWIDRIFIALLFVKTPERSMTKVSAIPTVTEEGTEVFNAEGFRARYQGLLFDEDLRKEKKSIQIIYEKSFSSAENVGHILEGSGARVVDITNVAAKKTQKCVVIEDTETFSHTAQYIAHFLHCDIEKGKTDIYDTIVQLGEREGEWEVCGKRN